MPVHQCPRCELRFTNEAELINHMTSDHQVDPQSVERIRYGSAAQQKPLYSDFVESDQAGPRRILVVASASLRSKRLQESLLERAEVGEMRYHLVVPAVVASPVSGEHSWFETVGQVAHPREQDLAGHRLAKHRLDEALGRLQETGLRIEGSVGDPDPMRAASEALTDFTADEIILSTLPMAQSGWLGADLHKEMERRFNVPVTVVSAV